MIEGSERCDVWEVTQPRARVEHECTECHRQIDRGEPYLRIGALFEGQWDTMRVCQHCQVGADWLTAECGGFCTHGVREDIHEHAQEYRTAGLWRLVVGAGRKWLRFDGNGLMPVPKLPALSHPTINSHG